MCADYEQCFRLFLFLKFIIHTNSLDRPTNSDVNPTKKNHPELIWNIFYLEQEKKNTFVTHE